MDFSNEARVKVGTYEGKGEVAYSEDENRFTIMKSSDQSAASIIAGSMFGLLGRFLVKSMSSGKELGSFIPGEIAQVKRSATEYHVAYYFYPINSSSPYEITVEANTYLNTIIKKLFADKITDIVAR